MEVLLMAVVLSDVHLHTIKPLVVAFRVNEWSE